MLETVVAACTSRPWRVLAAAVVLTVLGAYATVTRFSIDTNTAGLISRHLGWRQDEIAFYKAFPQTADLIVAVIDGDTPEKADAAAARLAAALAKRPALFHSVSRPDAGPFFRRNGLLLLAPDELAHTLAELRQQRFFLAPLAADPSLRGVTTAILTALQGVTAGLTSLDDLAPAMTTLGDAFGRVAGGASARLSWQQILSGRAPTPSERRKLILIHPALDYSALEPGAAAIQALRTTARELGLTPDQGVRVRLTGDVPLADEEFATVAQNAPLTFSLTILVIALILFLALRSGRVIVAVLVTLFAGLVVTAGLGLLLVGEFNLISVAFAVLFVGLGVDFGIQFAVRYRAERHGEVDLAVALRAAGRGVGGSLTLAAVALLAGFLSFLPTDFRGVSELGLIAGIGMIVAYVANLTLLPALLMLMRAPPEHAKIETASLAGVDRWIAGHRRLVLVATAVVVLAGVPALVRMHFDSNPMDLRSKSVESVSTFLDLSRDPDTSPNVIEVLAPSLAASEATARQLQALPQVARAVTLASFVPDDQPAKLAAIGAAASDLAAVLDPPKTPAPSDAATVAALHQTVTALDAAAAGKTGAGAGAAHLLADSLGRLAAATPERRAAGARDMVGGLAALLAQLRTELAPTAVTAAGLPADLRAEWVAPDGRVRIEVSPKGDANNNRVLARFAAAVRRVAPHATGAPITIIESGRTIVWSFAEAGFFAFVAIFLILVIVLRRPLDVVLTLGPLVLAGVMSLEAATLLGIPLNFANIIALPLMFGVGVAFHIYYVIAWRAGVANMLASSLTRAIFFSALTTGTAFGSLCLSKHPGTASMGQLLLISLVFTLAAAFIIVPAFLGPPREDAEARDLERWSGSLPH